MNRKGFTPDDIETIASSTASDSAWAAAADRAEQQLAQELPSPATPCFTQADVDEFLARKPQKYQMTEKDFQELGRNMVLGVGDLITSTLIASMYGATLIPTSNYPKGDDEILYFTTGDDGERQAWGENGRIF